GAFDEAEFVVVDLHQHVVAGEGQVIEEHEDEEISTQSVQDRQAAHRQTPLLRWAGRPEHPETISSPDIRSPVPGYTSGLRTRGMLHPSSRFGFIPSIFRASQQVRL